MRHKLFLVGIILFFVSGTKLAAGDTRYILCPAGEGYVYLYQTADNFQAWTNLKCGQKVEIVDAQNSPSVRVRTANGKEGYVQQSELSDRQQQGTSPAGSRGTQQRAPAPAASGLPSLGFDGYPRQEGYGTSEERDYSRVDVFGAYSLGVFAPSEGLPNQNGFDTSASFNLRRWFGVEGDFDYNFGSVVVADPTFGNLNVTIRGLTFGGGPRFTYRQGRLAVFGHLLVGEDRLSASLTDIPSTPFIDISMAGVAGAGADINVSKHVAVRSQADYLATHHFSILENNHRFSFGLVIRL